MGKIILLVVIILALIGGVFFFSKRQSTAPTVSNPAVDIPPVSISASPTATIGAGAQTFTITYSNNSVDISNLSVKVGDTVKFLNKDSIPHWPASGAHPIHQTCSGFDALKSLATGETYSFTFREIKTCPFHDHLNAGSSALKGQIIVTQ